MTRAGDPFACRLARRWVRLYTARLAHDARDRRRAEIDSDLWEHVSDARIDQRSRTNIQLAVLARVLFGVPSDVTWARRTMKEQRSMKQHVLRITAVSCIAIAIASFFGTNLLLDRSEAETADTIWWVLAIPIGFMLMGTIGVVATVLLVRDRRRTRLAGVTGD